MDEERYPTEYPVPDIAPYRRGNTGIDYVHTFDSGRPGPHVMINALTHGNEVCGAYAVDQLFRWETRPARGKLTLSFANVDAFSRFSPERPADTRWVDEDFNRVWSDDKLDGPRASSELARARELRPLIAAADLLLDLHSMHLPAPPVTIAGPHAKGRELARRLGLPAFVISDSGHATGARMRDYGGFGDAGERRRTRCSWNAASTARRPRRRPRSIRRSPSCASRGSWRTRSSRRIRCRRRSRSGSSR